MVDFSDSLAWLTRRDGSVVVGFGPFSHSAHPMNGVAFYSADFSLNEGFPWKIPKRVERMTREDFSRLLGEFLGKNGSASAELDCRWKAPVSEPFSQVFQEIMAAIRAGEFEKTVPVVTESGETSRSLGLEIAAAMARQPAPLQSYGWAEADAATGFAGATPELLFSLDGLRLETMALAGTARSGDCEVFAVDEKEIREHEYVAEALVSKLIGLGKLERSQRKILDLGPIVHFLTWIQVNLNAPLSPEVLLEKLHPTPALGPLPRTEETMARLLEWRNRLGCPPGFGAPFGLWDSGRFEAVVAIRGIWWQENQLSIPTGCGIIEASRLVNEWSELRLKREAVKHFLSPGA